MTDPSPRSRVPGDQEPAEGSRETVDAALEGVADERASQSGNPEDPDSGSVFENVPDA